MIRFPNCKINLGLHILEKLPDGYHRIETVFYPLGLSDILEINPSASGNSLLTISGLEIPGDTKENLCFRVWQLLKEDYGIPAAEMHLHKIIPTGAGLGGGSADAAFSLAMLNDLFETGIPNGKLITLAARLGMDCPYFLMNTPALGTGKGEILTPISLSLKGMHIVLVKPGIHVSSAEAYAGVIPLPRTVTLTELIRRPIEEWKQLLENDFEESVFQKYPEISIIKEELYAKGAVYASMSGSGSAVYGIFRKSTDLTGSFTNDFLWQGIL